MTQDKFKKTIDNARQILVGKLPNPQDQIDAITYALMYKFMNDIDDKSASLPGGKRTYFAGDYEKYSWHNLMRADGHDQLILYREAIEKMSKNANLPELFREIFNGAVLKFSDARTLRLFLKEMDRFTHGAGDSLGDSYEYLLSLMGSQGDLGQFRTPRHIIKFIVDAVDPDKTDRIIDPAVGTGGFLIEAYNHILRKYDGRDEHGNQTSSEKRLTAGELDKIHGNFRGFDIDATMIRTARVNLYLHGFKTPDIIEHDSLTSEDYWNDRYDIILANPPFMTPKGGIQPHKKFGIKSKKAEALFVDYLATHLKPTGKAGIIVPDGIVNNSDFADLRELLVKNSGLYAVVSLHQYVFKPYAGAKTSILLFDKTKENKKLLFINVEDDGFSKGDVRNVIDANDLPDSLELIKQFQKSGYQNVNEGINVVPYKIYDYDSHNDKISRYTEKYTLFASTFIYDNSVVSDGEKHKLSDVFNVKKGTVQSSKATPGQYRFVTASDEELSIDHYEFDQEAIIIATGAGGSLAKPQYINGRFTASDLCLVLTPRNETDNVLFYYYYLKSIRPQLIRSLAKGVSKQAINSGDLKDFYIRKFTELEQADIAKVLHKSHQEIHRLRLLIEDEKNKILQAMSE